MRFFLYSHKSPSDGMKVMLKKVSSVNVLDRLFNFFNVIYRRVGYHRSLQLSYLIPTSAIRFCFKNCFIAFVLTLKIINKLVSKFLTTF